MTGMTGMPRPERGISPPYKPLIVACAAFLFACSGSGQAPGEGAQATAPDPPKPQMAVVASLPAPEPARSVSAGEAVPEVAPGEAPPEETDADGPADEAPRPARRAPSGNRVYSNEDLKKYSHLSEQYGFREGTVVADLSAQQTKRGDTVEKTSVPSSREEWDREYRATFKEIERLTEQLKYLEGRAASLHNPFLPRAKVNEADGLAEAGMDNKERLARVNEQIAQTQRDLDAARRRFSDIQEHVPPESPSADR